MTNRLRAANKQSEVNYGTSFDLAEDELQIFLAEADEHLQTLDEGLVRLERGAKMPNCCKPFSRGAHPQRFGRHDRSQAHGRFNSRARKHIRWSAKKFFGDQRLAGGCLS